jgi:pimeloyl-ACP methyl ester carboxylesterase
MWTLPHAVPRAAVMYFHGNGGNLSVWLPILAGVYKQGFTVHAIDYRGYGASTGRPTERGLYRDVDATLESISARLDRGLPLVYWGRSLGTTMAAYAASRRRPAGLILEAGFPDARSLLRASGPRPPRRRRPRDPVRARPRAVRPTAGAKDVRSHRRRRSQRRRACRRRHLLDRRANVHRPAHAALTHACAACASPCGLCVPRM